MTNIGKPYEGKPHVRFDEEGLVTPASHSTERPMTVLRKFSFIVAWSTGENSEVAEEYLLVAEGKILRSFLPQDDN